MKRVGFILLLLSFISCAEKKTESLSEEDTAKSVEISEASKKAEGLVPNYDYSDLEPLLTKHNDTTYVINFWATWCKPCIAELPAFEKVTADRSEEKIKVLLVSLDDPRKIEQQVIPFMEKNNLQSQVVLLGDPDANSWIPKISTEWSGAIPATLIYKNDTRKFYEQSFTFEELEQEINTFINL